MQQLVSDSRFFWLEKSMTIHLPGPRPKNCDINFPPKLVLFLTFIKSFSAFGSFVGENLS